MYGSKQGKPLISVKSENTLKKKKKSQSSISSQEMNLSEKWACQCVMNICPYSHGTFSVPDIQHAHSTMGSPHLFFTVELKTIFSTSCTCTQNCPLMGVLKEACFILRLAGCHHVYPKCELLQKRGSNLPFYLFLQEVYFLMVFGDYNILETGFPCVPVLAVLELVL